MTYPAVFKI